MKVQTNISTVTPGHQYSGVLTIGNCNYNFDLQIMFPIGSWDHSPFPSNMGELYIKLKRVTRTTLRRGDGEAIEINDESLLFLFAVITRAAVSLHNISRKADGVFAGEFLTPSGYALTVCWDDIPIPTQLNPN